MQITRTGLIVLLLSLSACVGTPPPPPTEIPATMTPTPTEARSTPSTRTAPTLPPEWTKTFTPTFTPTLTPSITLIPTETGTPTDIPAEAAVCQTVSVELPEDEDLVIRNDEGYTFVTGSDNPDVTLVFTTFKREAPETPFDIFSVPGGQYYMMSFGAELAPGIYDWSVTVTTSIYTDICPKSGVIIVVSPDTTLIPEVVVETPTEEPSLMDELLGVVIRRLRRALATATPAAP